MIVVVYNKGSSIGGLMTIKTGSRLIRIEKKLDELINLLKIKKSGNKLEQAKDWLSKRMTDAGGTLIIRETLLESPFTEVMTKKARVELKYNYGRENGVNIWTIDG